MRIIRFFIYFNFSAFVLFSFSLFHFSPTDFVFSIASLNSLGSGIGWYSLMKNVMNETNQAITFTITATLTANVFAINRIVINNLSPNLRKSYKAQIVFQGHPLVETSADVWRAFGWSLGVWISVFLFISFFRLIQFLSYYVRSFAFRRFLYFFSFLPSIAPLTPRLRCRPGNGRSLSKRHVNHVKSNSSSTTEARTGYSAPQSIR
jgi:hypothetical protein